MKTRTILVTAVIATMGLGSLSFAQGFDPRGPGGPGRDQRVEQRDGRGFDNRNDRRNDRRVDNRDDRRDGRNDGPRGFDHRDARNDRNFGARGPDFRRGGHIPPQYRSRQYVVNDWRGHHLSAPPRGQQWVQVGADYALIAIATGVIASLVLSQ